MTTNPDPFVRPDNTLVVFFDGACPLCSREIAHYRGLRSLSRIDWVDISRDDAALAAHGLAKDEAMERLHVRDAAGQWQTGAWAFAALWSSLPGYRWLAAALRRSQTLPLLDRAYARFARWRLKRQCASGTCDLPAPPGGRSVGSTETGSTDAG